MDAEGEESGPPKKRIRVPPKRKKRSIYSRHSRSGSKKGTDADTTAPVAAADTNDVDADPNADPNAESGVRVAEEVVVPAAGCNTEAIHSSTPKKTRIDSLKRSVQRSKKKIDSLKEYA